MLTAAIARRPSMPRSLPRLDIGAATSGSEPRSSSANRIRISPISRVPAAVPSPYILLR